MKHCIYLSLPQGIIRTQPSHNEVVVNSKGPFHIFPRSNFNPQPCYPRMIFSSLSFFFFTIGILSWTFLGVVGREDIRNRREAFSK